jgi:hypothetical protein
MQVPRIRIQRLMLAVAIVGAVSAACTWAAEARRCAAVALERELEASRFLAMAESREKRKQLWSQTLAQLEVISTAITRPCQRERMQREMARIRSEITTYDNDIQMYRRLAASARADADAAASDRAACYPWLRARPVGPTCEHARNTTGIAG